MSAACGHEFLSSPLRASLDYPTYVFFYIILKDDGAIREKAKFVLKVLEKSHTRAQSSAKSSGIADFAKFYGAV